MAVISIFESVCSPSFLEMSSVEPVCQDLGSQQRAFAYQRQSSVLLSLKELQLPVCSVLVSIRKCRVLQCVHMSCQSHQAA